MNYYEKRIGKEYFNKLIFDFGYINSDKSIKSASEKYRIDSTLFDYWETPEICDSLYNFPVYTSAFNLELPEIGIKKSGINLVIDSKGKIIKDFQYPVKSISLIIISTYWILKDKKQYCFIIPFRKLSIRIYKIP